MFHRLAIVGYFILILGNIVLSQRFTIGNSHCSHQRGGINNYTLNYMCEYCPPMWTRFQNSCYRFFGNATNIWQDAEAMCKSFFSTAGQGHLVSILSEAENNFVYEFWRSSLLGNVYTLDGVYNADDSFLIGLHDINFENTFEWSDGNPVIYTNWKDDQPNNWNGEQDCSIMRGSQWNDFQCENNERFFPFICKLPIEQ